MRLPQPAKKSAHKKDLPKSSKRQKSVGDDTKGGLSDRPFKRSGDALACGLIKVTVRLQA
ncbi:hypothetical protein [Pseudomonas neuropathica]|uniref:hypothetical protein n=1 Tax=Pseudomonas neuropathica TaxID=2730425 RepID=UPI003EBA1F0A